MKIDLSEMETRVYNSFQIKKTKKIPSESSINDRFPPRNINKKKRSKLGRPYGLLNKIII